MKNHKAVADWVEDMIDGGMTAEDILRGVRNAFIGGGGLYWFGCPYEHTDKIVRHLTKAMRLASNMSD